ncbi:MAG TPA: inositol monophosphatase family protein [Gemmataceae bacterium]|nr:inositol monophosphatase family protein [Gemmataceae bacterium]
MNPDWRARYDLAVEAAEKAAQIAQGYFPEGDPADFAARVEWKLDRSPVTAGDRAAEAFLRNRIINAFPRDGFLGEEYGEKPGDSGFRWVVDPIDGTRNFMRGMALWGTLVGVEHRGEAIAGAAVMPSLGHTWRALRGDGAFRDGRRLRVSDTASLDDAVLACSSLSGFFKAGREAQFLELARRTQRQRAFGHFYGFVLVADGAIDVMVEHGLHVWDVAAVAPIIEEAGGRFTDWDGRATIHRTDVVASNGRLHDETLRILNAV